MSKYQFNPIKVAAKVQKKGFLLYVKNHFFIYKKNSVFEPVSDIEIYKMIENVLENKYREKYGREVKHCLMLQCNKDISEINPNRNLINLQNGMFDLESMKLFPHDVKYYSTIQLPVKYDINSRCDLWFKTIDEIFMGKQWKIDVLQEFFGYCLTTDNSHQTALINYGQGSNGKSLIFKVFETILGKHNISSVPISQLGKRCYLAEMFGRLVNLSIESETNIEINDANFKAIVTGDTITVDEKYGKPFSFQPFCKLIFAMNTLPYVSDKTASFYNRTLILNYEREFSKKERDRNLYHKLVKEIDGIFLWMLQGLKRLNKNGSFTENEEMFDLIEEYKRENNPTLTFVEEELEHNKHSQLTKKDVYKKYVDWCKENGYKPFSDKRLSKTIKVFFPNGVSEERTRTSRYWDQLGWVDKEPQGQEVFLD